ncbi:hypothetical protein ACK8P5_25685 (plasmid) [Paenibacillus sp. EC2-1]|uniref:hypothetical protein n=1 Tax=Paenibacillus sp. EC2-1 TaxID=3388665 RepID=UPI003BEF3E08
MSTQYAKTLTSFSGADLQVNFGPKIIGELQQISWGIKREKAPVFTLGSADARSFSRGKRGIGGSLQMLNFNRDALIKELVDDPNVWNRLAPGAMFTAAGNLSKRGSEVFNDALTLAGWNKKSNSTNNQSSGSDEYGFTDNPNTAIEPSIQSGNNGAQIRVPSGFGVIRAENIVYADMIPPFDATMTFANEYGQAAFQKIYDIDIMDESSGMSVDSIVMERQMGFVARRISPLMEGVYYRDGSGNIGGKEVYA